MKKASLVQWEDLSWSLYDETGKAIEHDFNTRKQAITWAEDNGYKINY